MKKTANAHSGATASACPNSDLKTARDDIRMSLADAMSMTILDAEEEQDLYGELISRHSQGTAINFDRVDPLYVIYLLDQERQRLSAAPAQLLADNEYLHRLVKHLRKGIREQAAQFQDLDYLKLQVKRLEIERNLGDYAKGAGTYPQFTFVDTANFVFDPSAQAAGRVRSVDHIVVAVDLDFDRPGDAEAEALVQFRIKSLRLRKATKAARKELKAVEDQLAAGFIDADTALAALDALAAGWSL